MATCAPRNRRANDNLHWEFMYLSRPEEGTHMLPPVYFPRGVELRRCGNDTCNYGAACNRDNRCVCPRDDADCPQDSRDAFVRTSSLVC